MGYYVLIGSDAPNYAAFSYLGLLIGAPEQPISVWTSLSNQMLRNIVWFHLIWLSHMYMCLYYCAERMFIDKVAPYPVERTLLVWAILLLMYWILSNPNQIIWNLLGFSLVDKILRILSMYIMICRTGALDALMTSYAEGNHCLRTMLLNNHYNDRI